MTPVSSKSASAWPPPESAEWTEEDRALLSQLDQSKLPRHVAVIMDGNGRWAKARGLLDRIRGHEAGIESVREITRSCGVLRIEALTLYSFSKENWRRPRAEVTALMRLLERFLVDERPELMDNNVRLEVIGQSTDLPRGAQEALQETMQLTSANTGLRLILALSYGARDELLRAIRKAYALAKEGKLDIEELGESELGALLDTHGIPDPDLLIRTSGEMRISNFLLWQIAYSEIYVTPVLWPDFRRKDLLEAIIDYQKRERRYGGVDAGRPRQKKA